MKKLIATALLIAPIGAVAQGEPLATPRSFQRDGVTFTYTSVKTAEGTRIAGKDSLGRSFQFLVAGKRVTGDYADRTLEFRRPTVRSALAQSAD
jgi:hypothetical protein